MATTSQPRKPSTFLLFPWGLTSIVLIILLNTVFSGWFGKNWSWLTLVLIIPVAIFENLKVGYTSMRVMFLKLFYSLISFLVTGLAFGVAGAGWYYKKFQNHPDIPKLDIPWYVFLALIVILLIELAQIWSMLKAAKREFMQFDPDQ